MKTNPHTGHRKRLKDRFLKDGLDNFEPHNLIEFVLFFTIPQGDTNVIAHNLLKTFGSFAEVCNAPISKLTEVPGVGMHTATLLKAIPQISRQYLVSSLPEEVTLDSSKKLGNYLMNFFIGRTDEVLYLLCLDEKYQMLKCTLLSTGSVNKVAINVRKVVEETLSCNACSIILAHNHPRGLALPSDCDIDATISLKKGLKHLDIRLDDHIVVSGKTFISIKELNLLDD